jgi:hypothetical protein
VGDAFLLSWKLCDGVLEGFANFTDMPDEETRLQANETVGLFLYVDIIYL